MGKLSRCRRPGGPRHYRAPIDDPRAVRCPGHHHHRRLSKVTAGTAGMSYVHRFGTPDPSTATTMATACRPAKRVARTSRRIRKHPQHASRDDEDPRQLVPGGVARTIEQHAAPTEYRYCHHLRSDHRATQDAPTTPRRGAPDFQNAGGRGHGEERYPLPQSR
jgi:hypothetical protein